MEQENEEEGRAETERLSRQEVEDGGCLRVLGRFGVAPAWPVSGRDGDGDREARGREHGMGQGIGGGQSRYPELDFLNSTTYQGVHTYCTSNW